MLFDVPAVGRAVDVVLPGDECLDRLNVHLPHTLELADLDDPVALELFSRRFVLHILESEVVGKPTPGEPCDKR